MNYGASRNELEGVHRIALINPTKFLGNLLLAGQLMQHLSCWCKENDVELLLVLDQQFQSLIGMTPLSEGTQLVFYPRPALQASRSFFATLRHWLSCVQSIRRFRADLAFHLEEDSVSLRLTRLSGARRKIGSATSRSRFAFDRRLTIERAHRPAGERSIWHVFREIFEVLQLPVPSSAAYINFDRALLNKTSLANSAVSRVLQDPRPKVVVHAGASKFYKKWPVSHFVELCRMLLSYDFVVILIGHGRDDEQINLNIVNSLGEHSACHNFNGQLDLPMLASLIAHCQLMVGNDSGPSHLGSALGVPGVVIFGPTEIEIWRPLGEKTRVLSNKAVCRSDCSRQHCDLGYACLQGISAQRVYLELMDVYGDD